MIIRGGIGVNTFKNAKNEITKGKWKYIFLSSIIFFIQ